ncbi:MAG: tRNA (N(6)-L-threonylcarbamoyladenosine(37)-C(2))-methylthiotransferase MtaB [Treponema sp. CETP13]|nr:MAG: tRNA (N(6)-L-threonylcarbamoyladenosine(37)-C(2))-methylthiotransferase MtaB [Treponema sp. CETP13]
MVKKIPQIHFETLGCKLNQIETESVAHYFIEAGYACTMKPVLATQKVNNQVFLCVINTCTVTSKAEQKCRRVIRLLIEKYPFAAIIVTGCYAQLDADILSKMDTRIAVLGGQSKGILASLPKTLNLWFENNTIPKYESLPLASKLRLLFSGTAENAFGEQNKLKAIPKAIAHPEDTFKLSTTTFLTHSRASIKIQDGCNNKCAYCRICFARGPSVSLEAETVLERVQKLEKAGHHEVVITGVNLTQYKVPVPKGCKPLSSNRSVFDFADLLQLLLDNTNSIKFRISSLYPERVDAQMCSVLSHKRIQPHFHLSVQSGSDIILRAMHRPYKAEQIIQAVRQLRKVKENPFIACDIITGFPGETKKDFDQTLSMVKICKFSWIHAFPFSPRPGTEAYSMGNQIPKEIAKERVQELTKIAIKNKEEYVKSCIGKDVSAIVEKRQSRHLRVVTENFLHLLVSIPFDKSNELTPLSLGGKQVSVKITDTIKNGNNKEIDGYCQITVK